jgi:hypothetical protein
LNDLNPKDETPPKCCEITAFYEQELTIAYQKGLNLLLYSTISTYEKFTIENSKPIPLPSYYPLIP